MRIAALAIAALAALPTAPAAAQTPFPAKPVTVVVTYAAGGTTDTAARLLAAQLEKNWRQKVIVENRPGAGQVIGTDYVIRSAPDGYTLLMAGQAIAVEQVLNKSVSLDVRRDLTPLAIVVGSGLVMAEPASMPAKNLAEWVNYAKANPGKVNWATVGSIQAEFAEFVDRQQLNVTYVLYKGGMQSMQAVASGDVQMFAGSPLDALELSKSGKIRPLAYTGPRRHRLYPDLPTVSEALGYPVDAGFWFGLFGPAKLPADIAARLSKDVLDAAKSPEVAQKYETLGFESFDDGPAQIRTRLDTLIRKVDALVAKGIFKQQ